LACHVADIPIAIFTDKLDRTLLASLVGLDQAELLSEPNIIKREIANEYQCKKERIISEIVKENILSFKYNLIFYSYRNIIIFL